LIPEIAPDGVRLLPQPGISIPLRHPAVDVVQIVDA
jgi:hypothetical protein